MPRWSRFPITIPKRKVYVRFTAEFEANNLSQSVIPDANQERHDIIHSLLWHRYNAKEIAEYLNTQGYRTPHGKSYYPELVGATISKLRRRLKGVKVSTPKVSELTFWLKFL